jgi:hypothetical protein
MTKFNLYKPGENAEAAISKAVLKAKKEKKHVFVQIGGNWCVWCARFEEYVKTSKVIDSIVKADYVVYHLNYSKENTNAPVLAKYGYPQRFVLNRGRVMIIIRSWNFSNIGIKKHSIPRYIKNDAYHLIDNVFGVFYCSYGTAGKHIVQTGRGC